MKENDKLKKQIADNFQAVYVALIGLGLILGLLIGINCIIINSNVEYVIAQNDLLDMKIEEQIKKQEPEKDKPLTSIVSFVRLEPTNKTVDRKSYNNYLITYIIYQADILIYPNFYDSDYCILESNLSFIFRNTDFFPPLYEPVKMEYYKENGIISPISMRQP